MATIKLFSTFALAGLAVCQMKQMVQAPFNAKAYNEYMDCVHKADPKYEIAIQSGTIAVVPPEGSHIDLDGPDTALEHCLHRHSHELDLAIDGSRFWIGEDDKIVVATQDLATAEWAESHGAQGMTSHPITNVHNRGLLDSRSPAHPPHPGNNPAAYFYHLGAEDEECKHYDSNANVYNECINFNSPFRAIRFHNIDQKTSLRVTRWPHHQCAVDYTPPGAHGKSVSVGPDSVSSCLNYPTAIFSFYGKPGSSCCT